MTTTAPDTSLRGIVRGVATLSVGTVIVQSVAMLSQVIFAFWLTPAQFGYWASAGSLMVVLTALTNLGEVNGYLANPSRTYDEAPDAHLRANLALMVTGL